MKILKIPSLPTFNEEEMAEVRECTVDVYMQVEGMKIPIAIQALLNTIKELCPEYVDMDIE